jgi:hypothetical protein
MSIASIGETLENPSVTQIMAAYPTKKIFDDAVKAGKIKPTREVGIVSNIFNRVVQSALSEQAQAQAQTTVLQDNTQPMGLAAAAQMPQQPRGQGLNQVPVPQQMFERQGMASGGIVAFQNRGMVEAPIPRPQTPSFTSALANQVSRDPQYLRAYQAARGEKMPRKDLVELMTILELQEFNRSGTIPERLSAQVQGRMIESIPAFDAGTYEPEVSTPFVGVGPEQVDPFSGTQTSGGAMSQTDPGAVEGDETPSAAILKQDAEDQAKKAAAQQAAAQQAAAQPAAIQPPVTEKVPEKRTMEQLIAERTGLYGEDPRKAAMKAALENASKESESDRILESLRLISAGEEKRTKGTTKELESLLADRAKKKAAAEQRAYKAADIEGMDYDTRRKAIDSILGEQREEAKTKEERKFRENLLTKELTAKENLNKEDIIARKEVARIAADSRPEQVMSKLFDIFRNGSPADKAAVSDFLTLQKGDLLSRLGGASGPDIKDAIAKYNIEPTR